jgi:hypothetical protein
VAGGVETGHRLTAPRRLLTVVLVTAVIVSVSGCGDDDDHDADTTTTTETTGDTGGTGTTTTVTISPELAAALTEYRERLASTREAIAQALQALGLTQVTPGQVTGLAESLCRSAFNPVVVTTWLQEQAAPTSIFLVQPANRLLRYSGTPQVCSRRPTFEEQESYKAALFAFLVPYPQASVPVAPPVVPTNLQAPSEVATAVCDVLGSQAGGKAAEAGLESLANRFSGGRPDSGEFISAVVWIAGASCKSFLPNAAEAVHRFFTGG